MYPLCLSRPPAPGFGLFFFFPFLPSHTHSTLTGQDGSAMR